MLVVGDSEQEAGSVAVRRHREGDQGARSIAEFAEQAGHEIAERR
jgi:threonyl-tRNA synthetase